MTNPSPANWRVGLNDWPRPLADAVLDPDATALMIIDMQNYDTQPDRGLGLIMHRDFPAMASYYYDRVQRLVIPAHVRLLRFFRETGRPVVFITVGPNLPDGSDMIPRRVRRIRRQSQATGVDVTFAEGSGDHAVIDDLTPLDGELVVNKTSAGAFNSTAIEQTLRNLGITGLVMTGVSTNTCVETTARDASDRGFESVLVEDACASFDEASHVATLRTFARMFGEVLSVDQVIERLSSPRESGG